MIIIEKREKQDGLFLRIPIYGDRILQKTAKYYSDSSMRLMTTSAEKQEQLYIMNLKQNAYE